MRPSRHNKRLDQPGRRSAAAPLVRRMFATVAWSYRVERDGNRGRPPDRSGQNERSCVEGRTHSGWCLPSSLRVVQHADVLTWARTAMRTEGRIGGTAARGGTHGSGIRRADGSGNRDRRGTVSGDVVESNPALHRTVGSALIK